MISIVQGIVPDTSVEAFKTQILEDFNQHLAIEQKRTALSDYQLQINGRVEMLEAVIVYLEKA